MKIGVIIILALLLIALFALMVFMFKFISKIEEENKKENEEWK